MRKIPVFFIALFLAFSVPTVPVVPAQMSVPTVIPVPVPASVPIPVAVVPPATDRIGVVAAAGGKVELRAFGQARRTAQSGQPVFLGDEVETDAQGHLQILLLDETVFTIGPNSAIIMDKFVYDPKSHKGEIKASITQGVFRYVSGKIAAKDPDSVKMKLPTATLGFRGTIVGGSVGANGQGLVGLLGPGNNNDAGAQGGSFTIDGAGGDHQDVNRTGFGVEVGANGGLSGVFQLSDEQMNGLTGGLGGGQGGGGQGGGGLGGNTDMGALSGENNVLAGDNVVLAGGMNNLNNNMDKVSTLGAQEALDESGAKAGAIVYTPTTFEQLKAASGSGHYANTGSYSGGSGGSMFVQSNIVFGTSGFIGGGNSYVQVHDGGFPGSDGADIGDGKAISFSGGSGPATFNWNEPGKFGYFDIKVTLSNSGEVTAGQAKVEVTYTNGGGGPASGTGTATTTLSEGALPS